MLSSRLKAFVMPTSQTSAIATASTSLPITSRRRPLPTTIAAAPNCAASLASGGRRRRSSIETRREQERTAAEDAPQLALAVHGGDREGESGPGGEAREDPDAAEGRCRAVVPALPAGDGDEPLAPRGAEEHPEHEVRDRSRGDRYRRAHDRRDIPWEGAQDRRRGTEKG